ncbi:uncharacterized protein JN550_002219 [Neoarthrinium moseri]|uniref:uncharacterized protein n=1 Tax=Neoarthrinium moseri TaxID=1658444 RepID=UPI001FDB63A5|nr:uncharacterized protein JN550_002219 [Neoarthrinium moseri]KAI1874790.1 hypothetical protein JN550_002219 [Neoarthrinium moseri]
MAGPRAARLQVGSAPWIAEERSSALQIAHDEIEEFTFSARNDFEWLNEHMADIFSENQINVAEIFKTPGKLRGKTPRTVRKANNTETRVPLSDIFSATPKGAPNPFAISNVERNQTSKVQIAADPIPQSSPVRTDKPAEAGPVPLVDSGYHGSQDIMEVDMEVDDVELADEEATQAFSPKRNAKGDHVAFHVSSPVREIQETPARRSPEPTATVDAMGDELDTQYFTANVAKIVSPAAHLPHHESTTPAGSPIRSLTTSSPKKTSPIKTSPIKNASVLTEQHVLQPASEPADVDADTDDASRSQSDGSSPIRPVVRKSSLNFASLPAREPMTHKSIGNRISRTSHLDPRMSYYNRPTGGKSLGNVRHEASEDDNEDMDVDDDEEDEVEDEVDIVSQKPKEQTETDSATAHNKTYTQRLQDQISKLGQSQPAPRRTSKSLANVAAPISQQASVPMPTAVPVPAPQSPPKAKVFSPKTHTTPGAFPEDDDDDNDDWIQPLGPPDNASNLFSPRPGMPKSYTADVMEGVSGKDTVSGGDFAVPKTRLRKSRSKSPQRPAIPERTTSTKGHHKSASVPSFPIHEQSADDDLTLKKTISVSNPTLATVSEDEVTGSSSPPKSPSRTLRDSPLKQVKNKLSSILKTSKGLLASSAAISAEGKSSLLSPSTLRLGLHAGPSTMSLGQQSAFDSQPLYPDLSQKASEVPVPASPTRTDGRRTRASIERAKAEEKRREKEAKEARRMAEQMEKLEKAREKEREKARVFSEEQEKVAAMAKQVAAQKEQEKNAPATTPAPAKPTRTSPRKAKAQLEAEAEANAEDDVDMADAPATMPPPSVPRPVAPASAAKGREIKRPTRPVKEPAAKAKQAPTVIRVNMGSQYQPSNSALASNLEDTLGSASFQPQHKSKASQASLHKSSSQSLKSSQSAGRPKALELAARRKEQEEREAQRKRDAKAEMERKRAALQEEERRQEQQRRLEAEKQKEQERRQAAAREEAKKNAQRQAMLEKAKQTRAPPPAARSVNGQPDYKGSSQSDSQPSRPPSRLGSTVHKSQEGLGRSVNGGLANGAKATTKRQLQQDSKESKRMRMTDEFDDVDTESQPSLKGAPVRPSGGFKKVTAGTMLSQGQKPTKPQDLTNKSMFPAGYANAPPSATRDLFKTTLTGQHNAQAKAAHPLDMAQVSKSTIPFAANANPAGAAHKTPARPVGGMMTKSTAKATRSSPRFQNGEQIELPEINTDDEDEYDDDDHKAMFASWTDSPALRRALVEQETVDPMRVFGAPAPLNMEEVFSKSKDRWHKFRQRTSSANWSGSDRLTEDDIRKDLAARDKLRREGAWTYEMGREML